MKGDQKFAFAIRSSWRLVRYGGYIENCDFDEEKDANVVFCFGMYLLLRYKDIGALKNSEDLQQINNFESDT